MNHWLVVVSPENRDRVIDKKLIGFRLGSRKQVDGLADGDQLFMYVTRVKEFIGPFYAVGSLYEDHSPAFKPGKAGDAYPLRIKLACENLTRVSAQEAWDRLPWTGGDKSFNLSDLMAWTVSGAMCLSEEEARQMTQIVTNPV